MHEGKKVAIIGANSYIARNVIHQTGARYPVFRLRSMTILMHMPTDSKIIKKSAYWTGNR